MSNLDFVAIGVIAGFFAGAAIMFIKGLFTIYKKIF